MIKDCIIFMPFRYFILDLFLDGRSRTYLNIDFANIQLFPIAKAFIQCYKAEELTIENYGDIPQIIAKRIRMPLLKNEFFKLSFEEYKKKEKKVIYSYLKSEMVKETSLTDDKDKANYNLLWRFIDQNNFGEIYENRFFILL